MLIFKNVRLVAASLVVSLIVVAEPTPTPTPKIVRVAVINGMMMTGLWPRLVEMFEADSDYKVEIAATGERDALNTAFRAGGIDLITMHSGDITTTLAADGFTTKMRPWTLNELVIVGPKSDPAGIKGLRDGAAALRKIS